ncbi:hypothetical protein QC763_0063180 [Podospora pseudopauciseta]|uniref:Heterokaryon incompatibility domain-containing protein n=1 Tax=Podospora pseudopauciseta TaxID=2093780 RepID=A0ABR0HBR6_9PEZI|nr:hypothetical protein QC763_0063180 [Podospora pseudopauciseta]
MRLLNTRTLAFKQFFGRRPPYAILSHTWDGEEVSHQDVRDQIPSLQSKQGYRKLQESCRIAAEQRLDWAWVDTCCIDKMNNAELTESINSMFRWYQQAAACFVYLSDLPATGELKTNLPNCRWFRRGWTLQELLAPEKVQFYDKDWNLRGAKDGLIVKLESITGIPADILTGHASIRQISIADRMSWAANRQTTRPEDVAYCLLGIFDVNLPMIYGEGENAFRRLQEEIIRKSNDMTIFAWQKSNKHVTSSLGSTTPHRSGSPLLATSPDDFTRHNKNETISILSVRNAAMSASINPEYIVTNKGLRITSSLLRLTQEDIGKPDQGLHYFLGLGEIKPRSSPPGQRGRMMGITLNKNGPDFFVRRNCPLRVLSEPEGSVLLTTCRRSFYIQLDDTATQPLNITSPVDAIAFPLQHLTTTTDPRAPEKITVWPGRARPESHWDETRRLFFRSNKRLLVLAISAFAIFQDGTRVELLMLVDQRAKRPAVQLFLQEKEAELYEWFLGRTEASDIHYWEQLPGELWRKASPWPGSQVEVVVGGGRRYVMSAWIQETDDPEAAALHQVVFRAERADGVTDEIRAKL